MINPNRLYWELVTGLAPLPEESDEAFLARATKKLRGELNTAAAPPIGPRFSEHYPHKCPRCGLPAYVGLEKVDCSMGCR